MAFSDALPGVQVSIFVDGQPLREYIGHEDDDDPATTTRYVESKTGQIFEVRIKVSDTVHFKGDCLGIHVYIDGKELDAHLAFPEDCMGGIYTYLSRGCSLPNDIIRKFQFEMLQTVADNKLYKQEAHTIRALGTLKVDIHHEIDRGEATSTFHTPEELGIVSEKGLKGRAISHAIVLAAAEPEPAGDNVRYWLSASLDPESGPAAIFLFNYRSLASLKAEMIIPRTPSPPPLEEKEDLTLEEIRELQRQNKELKARVTKIKRERDDDDSSSEPKKKKRKTHSGPRAGDILYTIDDSGTRQTSTTHLPARKEPVVIDLDSD